MKSANRWGCSTHTQVCISNRIIISNITENVMLFADEKNNTNIKLKYKRTILDR